MLNLHKFCVTFQLICLLLGVIEAFVLSKRKIDGTNEMLYDSDQNPIDRLKPERLVTGFNHLNLLDSQLQPQFRRSSAASIIMNEPFREQNNARVIDIDILSSDLMNGPTTPPSSSLLEIKQRQNSGEYRPQWSAYNKAIRQPVNIIENVENFHQKNRPIVDANIGPPLKQNTNENPGTEDVFVNALKRLLTEFKKGMKLGQFGTELQNKADMLDARLNKQKTYYGYQRKENSVDGDFRRKPIQNEFGKIWLDRNRSLKSISYFNN